MLGPFEVKSRLAPLELFSSALLFGLSAWLAKRATRELSGSEVAFWRFVIGLVFVFGQLWVRQVPLRFQRYDILLYVSTSGRAAVRSPWASCAKSSFHAARRCSSSLFR